VITIHAEARAAGVAVVVAVAIAVAAQAACAKTGLRMNQPIRRKIVAALSVLVGGFLIFGEFHGWRTHERPNLFWVVIGVLVIILGIIELASRAK
jgi:predicted membrane channel-forming protein YqfA (hemolysin III family)